MIEMDDLYEMEARDLRDEAAMECGDDYGDNYWEEYSDSLVPWWGLPGLAQCDLR